MTHRVDYEIDIVWVSAMFDGCWSWTLTEGGKTVASGTSYYRWTGILAAKRAARKHAHGLPQAKDDSRHLNYEVIV